MATAAAAAAGAPVSVVINPGASILRLKKVSSFLRPYLPFYHLFTFLFPTFPR